MPKTDPYEQFSPTNNKRKKVNYLNTSSKHKHGDLVPENLDE